MRRSEETRSHFVLSGIRWGRSPCPELDAEAHPLLREVLAELVDGLDDDGEDAPDPAPSTRIHSSSQTSPSRTRWLRSSNG